MASAIDLTTLSAVRQFAQIDAADTSQNALISTLITHASESIMRYTQREFVSTAAAGTARTFKLQSGSVVDLAPYDLRSVTQICIDTDGATPTPTTLTADEYRLQPIPARDGVYNRIEIRGYRPDIADSRYNGRTHYRVVEVTGTWGFASVPHAVEQATILTVVHWIRSFSAYFSQQYADTLEVPDTGRAALPIAARLLLDSYRKRAPR